MPTQNFLSNHIERAIDEMIKTGRFIVTDHISCFPEKRCDYCPLQGNRCTDLRHAYALKHHPELLI